MNILPQLIANSLIASSFYILVALGFNLMYGSTKFFNLSYGSVAIAGGYVTLFFLQLGLNVGFSIALGIVAAGLMGFIFEKGIFLPLRQRQATQMNLLIASLGISIALEALLAILFSPQIQSMSHYLGRTTIVSIAGASLTTVQITTILVSIVVFVVVAVFLKKTSFGKAVRAISDDEEVAKIIGIHTAKVIGLVFLLASAISAIAGVAQGFDIGLEPTLGFSLLLKGIIAAIVGGLGNIYGGLLGALILGFAENFGIIQLSGEWKDAIAFGVLIIVLIFKPKGILSK